MIDSKFKRLATVTFPTFNNVRIMMMPIVIGDPLPVSLAQYDELMSKLVLVSGEHVGKVGYLTIDEKVVPAGESHRRPGLHVDSVGEVTGDEMARLREENKRLEQALRNAQAAERSALASRTIYVDRPVASYGSREHGMLLVASAPGCNLYDGLVDGLPGSDGDCEHLRPLLPTPEPMQANTVYWVGGMCVHESLPQERTTPRQLVRLSYPNDGPWHEGYTESPLGVKPTGRTLGRRVYMGAV